MSVLKTILSARPPRSDDTVPDLRTGPELEIDDPPSIVTDLLEDVDHCVGASIIAMTKTVEKAERLRKSATRGSVPSIQEAIAKEVALDPAFADALEDLRKGSES